ncbi:MAG TPA: trigger factor [Nitrospinae bacterium]|jgi:trigger factor|nr:trigger factor [Nitrospinota bacterium]
MKIEIEDIDSCNKKINFVVPYQDYKKEVDKYYQKLGREVKVPGFRKGKVPASLLEKQFGPDVKKEVLSNLISDRLNQAIAEKELRAIGQPHLLEVNAEEGTDISVSASLEVLPSIDIQDYSGMEMEMKVPRITDEEVNQTIETFRQRKAKTIEITDRPVEEDDLIKVDFTSKMGDQPFEGGTAQDQAIRVGSGQLIEGLDKGMVGMKIGENREIQVKVPEDYQGKEIAGKDVDFNVTLKGIQEQELPELNDDFAREVDAEKKYESMEDMKAKVRVELEGYERDEAKKAVKKTLADKLAEQNPVELPEGLIKEQVKFMSDQANKKQGKEAKHDHGHDHDHDHDHEEEVSPELIEKYKEPAVKALREELILDQLSRDLELEVTPEELDQELQNMAQLLGGGDNLQQMKKEWEKNGVLARLHSRMKRDKTLNAALEKVTLKEVMVDRKDLIADN